MDDPVTASRLNLTWLRITGKDKWLLTTAVVYSYEWADLEDQVDSEVGFHNVVYSYRVGDERYVGKFAYYGYQAESYLHRGDTFTIRYNPSHPERSYYPELRTRHKFVLIAFAIGAIAALIVCTTSMRGC